MLYFSLCHSLSLNFSLSLCLSLSVFYLFISLSLFLSFSQNGAQPLSPSSSDATANVGMFQLPIFAGTYCCTTPSTDFELPMTSTSYLFLFSSVFLFPLFIFCLFSFFLFFSPSLPFIVLFFLSIQLSSLFSLLLSYFFFLTFFFSFIFFFSVPLSFFFLSVLLSRIFAVAKNGKQSR